MIFSFFLLAAAATALAQTPSGAAEDAEWTPDSREASMISNDDQAVEKGFTRTRKTIPGAFQGTFRRTLAECGQTAESALVVRPTKMHFAEKEADVQRVRVEGDRKIVVASIYDV